MFKVLSLKLGSQDRSATWDLAGTRVSPKLWDLGSKLEDLPGILQNLFY